MKAPIVLAALLTAQAHAQTATPAPAPAAPAAATPSPPSAAAPVAEPSREPAEGRIGLRLDCLHDFNRDKGSSQACITLTGLRYEVMQRLNPQLRARLRLDPFGSLDPGREDYPARDELPLVSDSELTLIDDYALTWTPRPNLEVGLESYGGATRMPRVTGLALENPFDDPGWKQTAVTVTYNLAALSDMRVRFAAGNGEGENGRNLDPQQYFGFEVGATIIQGLSARLGLSQDSNSIGSAQYEWLAERFRNTCNRDIDKDKPRLGYQTQRLGASLVIDGKLTAMPGLKLALAGQRSTLSDLDKSRTAYLVASDFESCAQIDADYLFVETAPGEEPNSVQKLVYGLSLAFTLLDDYTLAGSYTTRSIDTDKVKLFETCDAYSGATCVTPAAQRQSYKEMTEDALTLGGGFQLAQGLTMTLEYARIGYDRKYAKVFFQDQKQKTSDMRELFNARIAYDWR